MAVLRCTLSFAYRDKRLNADRVVPAGALVDQNDPAIKGREHLFETVEATVERATFRDKLPGRKRSTSTKTVAKDDDAAVEDEVVAKDDVAE